MATTKSNVIIAVEFFMYKENAQNVSFSEKTPKGVHVGCIATFRGRNASVQNGNGIFSSWWQKEKKMIHGHKYHVNLGKIPVQGIRYPQLGNSANGCWWEGDPRLKGLEDYRNSLEILLNK